MAPSRRSVVTPRRLLTLLIVLAAASFGAGVAAPQADAATPCWKRLINDWYDGRIDRTYPASCYRQAIKNLPEDVDAYSTAREDLERALLSAARRKGSALDADDPIPPGPGNEAGPKAEDQSSSENGDEEAAPPLPGSDGGDDGGLLETFRPSSADEIPVPLLVLGGLAVLLLGAAAASFVARKIQARKGFDGGPPVA
jgi:hypothetical protein